MRFDPSGFRLYEEYYLYADKAWEMAPSGVSYYNLLGAQHQNAPVIATASGFETTTPEEPWGQVSGSGKYEKIGFGYFDLLPDGQYNPGAYEFALHPESSGKLIFNGILRENVYIEYETGPSGQYIMDNVDYNPIRNEVEGGFVHFSQTTAPETLFLDISQESVKSDGYQGIGLTTSLYDADFDRVPLIDVIFEIQSLQPATDASGSYCETGYLRPTQGSCYATDASGYCIAVRETTNSRGSAYADYQTFDGKTGLIEVKSYVLAASGVYDDASFLQFYMSAGPFILDRSLLDTLDYLV